MAPNRSPIDRIVSRLPVELKNLPLVGGVATDAENRLAPASYDEVAPGLYVGDSGAGRNASGAFAHCVSVAEDLEFDATTESFDLRPTDSSTTREFRQSVEAVRTAWESGDPTLVHCWAGMERAPTVAATVLAVERDWSFDRALRHVRSHRSIVDPTPELEQLAEEYIQRATDAKR